jgi:2TM domain
MRGHHWHGESDEASLTDEQRLQREARHRAHRRMEFFQHLSVFVAVMILVLAIDVLTNGGWWIQWVAGIWGGILAIHYLFAFVVDDFLGPAMERRLTENQLRRLEERSRRGGGLQ